MFQVFEKRATREGSAAKLAALRTRLAEAGAGAFMVPRRDVHNGESVPPADERLAWLTGFTGSAGMAIVAAEEAALFVDGRYTLQAAGEVDTALLSVVPSHETAPETWVKARVSAEAPLAIDPWLHPPAEVERFAEALGHAPLQLAANPIDAAWQDRPARPAGAIEAHPESLAGRSSTEKRRQIGAAIAEAGAVAAVLTLPDSIAWLANIRGADVARSPAPLAFAIVLADGTMRLFLHAPERLTAEIMAAMGEGVGVAELADFVPALERRDDEGPLPGDAIRVLVDRQSCPVAVIEALRRGGAEPVLGRDPCIIAKALKTEAELEGMRAAHRRDGAAVCRFLAALERDLAAGTRLGEIDIARRLEAARAETGALVDLAFDTIAGSGPHGAIVHYRVTRESERVIQPGEILLVDSGGQYRDGTTDITRTLATGPGPEGGAPPEARRAFTLVLKGMIGLSRARWPAGLAGRDLDPLARAALWRAGLDYDHGTGHGVGAFLNVHEGPAGITRRSSDVALEPGMVLSNEPGCYREGAWGIRIENLVAVTPASLPEGGDRPMLGFETLTLAPIDRRLIERGLLEAGEIAWLDAYHARVAAEIGPLVAHDPETAEWLADACAPVG